MRHVLLDMSHVKRQKGRGSIHLSHILQQEDPECQGKVRDIPWT